MPKPAIRFSVPDLKVTIPAIVGHVLALRGDRGLTDLILEAARSYDDDDEYNEMKKKLTALPE